MGRKLLLAGIILAAILAGCIDTPPTPGQNGNVQNGVIVDGPTCTVDGESCESAKVTEYSIPKVAMTVRNTGGGPVSVALNSGSIGGSAVLHQPCTTYNIKEFRAQKQGPNTDADVHGRRSVQLAPGERLELTWFFEVADHVNVSKFSVTCRHQFQLSFQQSLQTVKQVQVRANDDIPRIGQLEHDTTSKAPVELVVDADSSMVQDVIGGEPKPMQATTYVVNRGSGNITALKDSGSRERIYFNVQGVQDQTCSKKQISGAVADSGKICRFVPPQTDSSQIYDIIARTTYQYQRDLGDVQLTLKPLEVSQ